MNNFFSEFTKSSLEDWEDKLQKELKGIELSEAFKKSDNIEGVSFKSYVHDSEVSISDEVPGVFPFKRSQKSDNNNWLNSVLIEVEDESEANKSALEVLMTGADALIFNLSKENINIDQLLNEIGLEYIQVHFIVHSLDQFKVLNQRFEQTTFDIYYRIDFHKANLNEFIQQISTHQKPFCFVNAFSVQQSGASIKQELAYALSLGNEFLAKLLESGLGIEKASELIHFDFGIGVNYFNEIAKFRAFRAMWSFVLKNYNHSNYNAIKLSASVGFVNKSLKDPFTNLLRQTTEVMSAIVGGVDSLTILPYDKLSTKGTSDFALRMAQNIPLILKEESYFDKVIDPLGGSYSIEKLTDEVIQISWDLFQELEGLNGVFNSECQLYLKKEIQKVVELKLAAYASNEKTLIGVNKFKALTEEEGEWKIEESVLGLSQFIIENKI